MCVCVCVCVGGGGGGGGGCKCVFTGIIGVHGNTCNTIHYTCMYSDVFMQQDVIVLAGSQGTTWAVSCELDPGSVKYSH